jgi:ligand-binding sensor protein
MTVQQFELKSKTEDISAEKSEMFNRLGELKAQGARLITITALDHGKEMEFVYNFAKGMDMINLHVKTPRRCRASPAFIPLPSSSRTSYRTSSRYRSQTSV